MLSLVTFPSLRRRARFTGAGALAFAAVAIAAGSGGAAASASKADICSGHRGAGVKCVLGRGRRTGGGGGKASHAGWPAITGIRWTVNKGTTGRTDTGTTKNDEQLGSHGGDTISGDTGNDVLWGDSSPTGNDEWQHDTLNGGDGKDWIYSSHGHNAIDGGAGDDHIFVHFGRGTVDCGSGYDIVKKTLHPKYTFKHCEKFIR